MVKFRHGAWPGDEQTRRRAWRWRSRRC